jgi:hypothetical protein
MSGSELLKRIKKIFVVILSAGFVIFCLAVVQKLVQPKYASDVLEGNFTAEYYKETGSHDVILIGDCEVYENIDPIYLWSKFGITSYIRGNAQQLTWQSYYMLEDTLAEETPQVVIYNVLALTHAEPQREEYNRMTLDGMRWSLSKWNAIQASMCDGEQMLDYIFPLLRYHSRITKLTKEDFTYFNKRRQISHNGYYMRVDVLPVSESDVADTSWLYGEDEQREEDGIADPWTEIEGAQEDTPSSAASDDSGGVTFGSLPMTYLDKIRCLCEENGIQLVLMKAPSAAPVWYDYENQQVVDYAEKYHIPYINFYEHLKETGLDYETDTYDGGLHMNLSGADKLSEYLGNVLVDEYHVKSHKQDSFYEEIYSKKTEFYEEMKEEQQNELKQYGEVRSY